MAKAKSQTAGNLPRKKSSKSLVVRRLKTARRLFIEERARPVREKARACPGFGEPVPENPYDDDD